MEFTCISILGGSLESWRIEQLVFLIPWCTEVSSSLSWHVEAALAALPCPSWLSKSLLLLCPRRALQALFYHSWMGRL